MTLREHDDLELISLRRLSDSLEATRTMLRQSQKLAADAHSALADLVSEFCTTELQAHQERGEDPAQMPANELARLLRERFKMLKTTPENNTINRLAEANRQLENLRSELETQRQRADQAEELVRRLEIQVRSLEKTLASERKSHKEFKKSKTDVSNMDSAPEQTEFAAWLQQWKSVNCSYERDTGLVLTIGKSGFFHSKELEHALVEASGLSRRTARRAILDCTEVGLLERQTAASTNGRPAFIITLTEKGRWLYRELTGTPAVESEYETLIQAHKSDRHLALILQVAEQFHRLGYEVDRQPLQIRIDEKHTFLPDLIVRKDGETFYLEVELGPGDKRTLPQKWENALAAGGRICVVTPNLNVLRSIQGSIAQWAIYEGRTLQLYVTYLQWMKDKEPGDNPWYAVKDYNSG